MCQKQECIENEKKRKFAWTKFFKLQKQYGELCDEYNVLLEENLKLKEMMKEIKENIPPPSYEMAINSGRAFSSDTSLIHSTSSRAGAETNKKMAK
jgi:hypothetical protein